MLKGIIKEVSNKIRTIENNRDDIFIVCASFEERTTAAVDRLDENFRVENSFVFKYDEKNRTNLREINFEKLLKILKRCSESISPIICNHHSPLDGINKLQELCKIKGLVLKNKNITVDITTFTKQYLLVLLKFIGSQNLKSVRLIYTEPEDYATKWKRPLSHGLIDIVSVPTYGGHLYIEKESLLVLLLGYEGDRSYAIWEKLAPHKTVILIGKPSFKDSWEGRVEELNKKLISKLPKDSIKYIPTLDPFTVGKSLDEFIDQFKQKFNIAISPLGPKPQVIGCYLSVRKYPDVQVIYAIPKFHDEKYFSKEVGKIWEYR